jgi:catechol 2,3-dioxygenase-like lactoylglutathione lyase family enzyme
MIGYVTLGSDDIPRAAEFYDELLKLLGAGRFMESETMVAWAVAPDKPALGVIKPFNGKPATSGNGVMISLVVDSNDKVDQIHGKAMALGAKDEGAPGLRGLEGFYAGYFRDLDGHKLNCYCWKTG